jgi:5-methyltetrahydrofolate--homocysteine methyltransferase
VPAHPGVHLLKDYDLSELREYIDWQPFFNAWEMKGKFPDILHSPVTGEAAMRLYDDAQTMLDTLIAERWLTASGVFGFFPANSVGDDIVTYTDASRTQALITSSQLRQQGVHRDGIPNRCLADFIAPHEVGRTDYLGGFAVTAGQGLSAKVKQFQEELDDYSAILLEALADRLAEAFAERLHERVRTEFWGYASETGLSQGDLLAEKYQGIRPAPGYPACPEHTEKDTLWQLLDAEAKTGIQLTESMAMWPGASVSGWYFSHPQSQYFVVGRLGQDQVADYASRKGWTLELAERWLSPNLGYDPED